MTFRDLIPSVTLAIILAAISTTALASQGPAAPTCSLLGKVIGEATRTEMGQGMSEGELFTYVDLQVRITAQEYASPADKQLADNVGSTLRCDHEPGSTVTFQLDTANQKLIDWIMGTSFENQCVRGTSRFFGDGNFRSGNWLTIIEKLPDTACALKQ